MLFCLVFLLDAFYLMNQGALAVLVKFLRFQNPFLLFFS